MPRFRRCEETTMEGLGILAALLVIFVQVTRNEDE